MAGMGIITKAYTIWCVHCDAWVEESRQPTERSMAKLMQRDGWKQKRGWWVCPECLAKDDTPALLEDNNGGT